jgi:hypothetical protein
MTSSGLSSDGPKTLEATGKRYQIRSISLNHGAKKQTGTAGSGFQRKTGLGDKANAAGKLSEEGSRKRGENCSLIVGAEGAG